MELGRFFVQANPPQEKKPNRLINQKSPYLLQHAYNPVDWYPWSQEAFDRARVENKLIFLSIGYATCHWCHVMEKETFEDPQTAALLNEAFVCIKVDREERPDLDATYMAVCQAMGRSCGWPLNVFLTPSLNPFFVASYIPKNTRHGTLGITELVPQILTIWKLRKDQFEAVGADIKIRIEAAEKRADEKEVGVEVLADAYDRLAGAYDTEYGGFGFAPKFPRGHMLMFLLRYWKRTKEPHALEMAEKTLQMMRLGGIFDQIGFGFHRYSTDAYWLVPHFEKMLYDQAILAMAYTEAYQATGTQKFKVTAKETLEYVLREMVSSQGGFCSAEDADSEGQEGKFYLWTKQEIADALQPADATLAAQLFDISLEGNYAEKGRLNGTNILHLSTPLQEIAQQRGITIDELIMRLGSIRNLLFEARNRRVHTAKDDKVLTDWNGLMIAALAKAGATFEEQRYVKAAQTAADFLLNNMQQDWTLYHRFAKEERAVEGLLDDYAFLVFGLIELYEATFEEKYLQAAVKLTKDMVTKFWDSQNGGFFLAQTAPASMPRLKQVYDGAAPSGNSVALLDLLRISLLTGDPELENRANTLLRAFSAEVETAPDAYTFLLAGLDFVVGPAYSVVLVGDLRERETGEMLAALRKRYLPNLVVSLKQPTSSEGGYQKLDGKPTAYVCRGQMCLPPTNSIQTMLTSLGEENC
jgi:uncharacterized protein YyaL (SSP411 family)